MSNAPNIDAVLYASKLEAKLSEETVMVLKIATLAEQYMAERDAAITRAEEAEAKLKGEDG